MFWMKNVYGIRDAQFETELLEWFCKGVMRNFEDEEVKKLLTARPEELVESQNIFIETIKKTNKKLSAIDFAKYLENKKKLTQLEGERDRINAGTYKGRKTLKQVQNKINVLNNKIQPIKNKLKDEYANKDYKSFTFDYDSVIKGDFAYGLASRLKVDVCVYCGRSYTSTIVDYGENVIRPTFDHYYPKSEYPLLALSFFNLVPSCYYCNSSIKGTREFSRNLDVHPYTMGADDINQKFRFTFNLRTLNKREIRLDIKDEKIENTAMFMRTEAIYQAHNDYELNDLIEKRKRYPFSRIMNLLKECNGLLNEKEIYQMILGDEIGKPDGDEFFRSLFKLKNDLAKELFPEGYKLLKE